MGSMKKLLPLLFVLILIGAIVEGLYIWHPEWFSFGNTPVTPLVLEESGEPLPPIHITENETYYDIEARYPGETPLKASAGATADAKVIEILKSFEENEIARFKDNEDFAHLTEEEAQAGGYEEGRKKILQIDYKEYASANTISYVFTMYQDTFGAHGNTFFRTFTFDKSTGEGLVLADLFTPGSAYLDVLTKLSREKLENQLGSFADSEMIDSGTTAYDDNFQNFYLDGDALVLLFPPYQVAAYAAGPQTVRIPLGELGDLLK